MDFAYRVDEAIFRMYPGYRLGVLVFTDLENEGSRGEITAQVRSAEESARADVRGKVAEAPAVSAWRDAYRMFGAKPAEHRSSIEALLRRVLKPDALPAINPLVDIGNIVSLRHFMPAGVHPIRHPSTNIELRLARGGDHFLAGADQREEEVTPGEVVLADQFEVLTRRWTWRQSVNTRMHASTKNAFFNIDALAVSSDAALDAAMFDAARLVAQFCRGKLVQSSVLSAAATELRCVLD